MGGLDTGFWMLGKILRSNQQNGLGRGQSRVGEQTSKRMREWGRSGEPRTEGRNQNSERRAHAGIEGRGQGCPRSEAVDYCGGGLAGCVSGLLGCVSVVGA